MLVGLCEGGTHAQLCSAGNIGDRRLRDCSIAVQSDRRDDGQQSGQCDDRRSGRQFRAAGAGSRVKGATRKLQSQDSLPADEHPLWRCPFPCVGPLLLRILSL
jgi:hypothetical protein